MGKNHIILFALVAVAALCASCEIDSGRRMRRTDTEIRQISDDMLTAAHSAQICAFYHALRLDAFMALDPAAQADSRYSDISRYPATGIFKSDAGYTFETTGSSLKTPGAIWTVKQDETSVFTITCEGPGVWTVNSVNQRSIGVSGGTVSSRIQICAQEPAADGSLVFGGNPWGLFSDGSSNFFIRLTGSKALCYKFRKDLPYFVPKYNAVGDIKIDGEVLVEICNGTGTLDWCKYMYYDSTSPVVLSSI